VATPLHSYNKFSCSRKSAPQGAGTIPGTGGLKPWTARKCGPLLALFAEHCRILGWSGVAHEEAMMVVRLSGRFD
jgi:hypothetical protein